MARKSSTLADLRQDSPVKAAVKGWLTKVKYGHSKRYFATLQDTKVYFFKSAAVRVSFREVFSRWEKCCIEDM